MKYLNVILTINVFVLATIATRVWILTLSVDNLSKNAIIGINAQHAEIAACDQLREDIKSLSSQLKDVVVQQK